MADIMSADERSRRMGMIRSKNTKPEMVVRRLIHSLGYRYRLYSGKLPGRPDLVFSRRKKLIFVHGCFWHMHEGCRINKPPKSKLDYWQPKLLGNVTRDAATREKLVALGWDVLVIWECETESKDTTNLERRIREFLGPTSREKTTSHL